MLSSSKREMIEHYNRGLQLYKNMQFEDALASFKRALELEPSDGPTQLYISRCEGLAKNPPPPDWDGVFIMTTK